MSVHTTGWLFRSIRGGGTAARSSEAPVSASTLAATVKACAAQLGFDPAEFATHGLRHGATDDFKTSGVPERVDPIFIESCKLDVSGIPGASDKRSWPCLDRILVGIFHAQSYVCFDPSRVSRHVVGFQKRELPNSLTMGLNAVAAADIWGFFQQQVPCLFQRHLVNRGQVGFPSMIYFLWVNPARMKS